MQHCNYKPILEEQVLSHVFDAASRIAKRVHKKQKYAGCDYLAGHLLPVQQLTKSLTQVYDVTGKLGIEYFKNAAETIAILHDTIEDSDYTDHELAKALSEEIPHKGLTATASDVLSKYIHLIAVGSEALARERGESYEDYINKLLDMDEPIILVVKLADIIVNMGNLGTHPKAGDKEWLSRKRQTYLDSKRKIKAVLEKVRLPKQD